MANTHEITLTVNGQSVTREVEPRLLLVYFLRDALGLTGTHVGCDTTQCGACTVMLGGKAVKSCTILTVQADSVSEDWVRRVHEHLAALEGPSAQPS